MTQAADTYLPISVNVDHVGGLVFGSDVFLYYVKSAWDIKKTILKDFKIENFNSAAFLCRINPITLQHEEVFSLIGGNGLNRYVSKGARDIQGNLYFGKVMVKLEKVRVEDALISKDNPRFGS